MARDTFSVLLFREAFKFGRIMKGKKSAALAQNNTPLVSLSSLFLGKSSKAARLDTELDDIFKSSVRTAYLSGRTLGFRLIGICLGWCHSPTFF